VRLRCIWCEAEGDKKNNHDRPRHLVEQPPHCNPPEEIIEVETVVLPEIKPTSFRVSINFDFKLAVYGKL
jgi:hypothetical protein